MKKFKGKTIVKTVSCVLLLSILLVALLLESANAMAKINPPMDKDVLNQDKAYIMQIEKIDTNQIKLYDKRNEIQITLDWYIEQSDFKNFNRATYFYNYSTDELFKLNNGELINVNDLL